MILYSKGQNIMDHLAGHMTMSRFASPPLKLVCRLHACPHISLKSPSTLVSIFHAVLSMYSVWFSFGSSARSKKKSRYNFANRTWQQILPRTVRIVYHVPTWFRLGLKVNSSGIGESHARITLHHLSASSDNDNRVKIGERSPKPIGKRTQIQKNENRQFIVDNRCKPNDLSLRLLKICFGSGKNIKVW